MIATGSGYFLYLDDGTDLRLAKGDSVGGLTQLGSFAYDHMQGVYYNLVLSVNGMALKGKVWSDAESEPAYQIEVTDAQYASGSPGQVSLGGATVDFDVFAAGLGGDPYPTGRNPGTPIWLTPVVPFTVPEGSPILHLSWTRPTMASLVMGGVVRYELEFQQNGVGGWSPIAIVEDVEFFDWDTSNLVANVNYCVRVRALVGCEFGPFAELCDIFIIGGFAVKESPDGYFFGDWFVGDPDHGQWIRKFEASHLDDDLPVTACWVTREFLPAGVGGEAVFRTLHLSVTTTTIAVISIIPILDGDRLPDQERVFQVIPASTYRSERIEVDLTKPFKSSGIERFRNGLRGSYIQFEICALDTGGTGRIEIDGLSITYLNARETHPWSRPFIGELETDVETESASRFYFGTDNDDGDEAAIYKAEEGSFDFGKRLRLWIETRAVAVAGLGQEAIMSNLYICITRSNAASAQINVTPILDGIDLETELITLAGTTFPLTEVLEIPLSVPFSRDGIERGRTSPRGVWFSYRITNEGERPDGEFAVNGAAIEATQARESQV